jgi:hypothetical protein
VVVAVGDAVNVSKPWRVLRLSWEGKTMREGKKVVVILGLYQL